MVALPEGINAEARGDKSRESSNDTMAGGFIIDVTGADSQMCVLAQILKCVSSAHLGGRSSWRSVLESPAPKKPSATGSGFLMPM